MMIINVNIDKETHEKLIFLCAKYDLVQKEIAGEMVKLGMGKFIEENLKGICDFEED